MGLKVSHLLPSQAYVPWSPGISKSLNESSKLDTLSRKLPS